MKHPAITVLIWLIGLAALAGWIARSIDVHHDLTAFLPDRDRPVERLLLAKADQGAISRTILMAFEGGTLDARLAASREAASLLQDLPGIEAVANGQGNLDFQAFSPLFPHRYLLRDPPSFDASFLGQALETRLKELRSPLGAMVKAQLADDPTASFRDLLLTWRDIGPGPRLEQGLWVSPDGARTLLLAQIDETAMAEGQDRPIIAAVRDALHDLSVARGIVPLLAGRPVLVDQARDSVRNSLVVGSILASGLVILLLLWMYRSLGVLLIGALPILTGVAAGLAAVLWIFGAVHGIALAFGITLLGITIDYPLHLFSHSRPDEPLARTAVAIQKPVLLGAFSTAGMFAMFGAGQAPGLGQLACFAAVGILTSALTLRFLLPDLAALFRVVPSPRPVALLPAKAPRLFIGIIASLVLLAGVLLMMRQDQLFEADIEALNPLPAAAKGLDHALRRDLGAPDLRHFLLIEGDDAETVLQKAEAMMPALVVSRASEQITSFDTPARYLPSLSRQRQRQEALAGEGDLAAALDEARAELPFKADLFAPFLQAVAASRQSSLLDGDAGLRLFRETPLGARLDQLLLTEAGQWYGFVPLVGMVDKPALQALADRHDQVMLVDLKALSEIVLADFRQEALLLLLLGFGVIILALLAFRYPYRGVCKIALVLLAATIVTTACLSLLGERLTMLHILSGLLVVGLGLDYAIFLSWPDADAEQRARTRHALFVCLISTVIVFGLLALSDIGLLRAIGLTVALGACTTFAIAYAVLSRSYDEV